MSEPSALSGVADADLDCLVGWPDGTRGHAGEMALVLMLNDLCKRYGYGRVPQLAAQIEDLWRHPERLEHYRRWRAEHLAMTFPPPP